MQIRAAFVIVALLMESGLAAQSSPEKQLPRTESISAGATAVLVDVVVRDKHGKPILDLAGTDFEIFEDGVRQGLGSFSVVDRGGGIGIKVGRRVSAPPADAENTTSSAGPSTDTDRPTVAIVFDALQPEALGLAQKAALSYLPMSGESDGRVGVFTSDPALRVLQPYTDNLALARRAVNSLNAAPSTKKEMEAERRQALNQRLTALDALGIGRDSQPFSPEPGGNATAAAALVDLQMTELEMRMLRTFDSLDRDQRGFGSTTALLSVIQSLAVLPGRKTLVYLSEGLPASPTMQARLDTLVSTANRANVSVYTIDAAGLRLQSTLSETRHEIDAAGQERLRQTNVSRDPSDGPMTRMVERTEDLLRLDPHTGLSRLAEDTGGFLIRDTNDLSTAFKRIDEDNRFHYMLTYSPTNLNTDGKFRTIQVKVKRDGAQVFARKGYLALRKPASSFLSYEAEALSKLDHGKPPNAFPVSATGFVFPSPKGSAAVPIVVQVKTANLYFQVDEARGTYTAQAAIVAHVKNAAGKPVHTLSQQYLLTGASKDLDAARDGEILFYRQPELPPGVYNLEVIVHDSLGQKASARLSTLTVPAASQNHVPPSTLVVVRRVERVLSAERPSELPFYYGDTLLYPNAGDPLPLGRGAELIFYFTFYKTPGENVDAALELLASGHALAAVPIDLPRPLPDGRVQHVGRLPIDKFPAGTYELRLHLHAGATEETRNAFFTIAQ
jgi:VWFA-related protein